MSNVFVTSDEHFGHVRIPELCGRPFDDVNEMDECLIANHNSIVGHNDFTWHLGDYALGDRRRGLSYLARMNGRHGLITGNHDKCWPGQSDGWKHVAEYLAAGFEVVLPFARMKLPPTSPSTPGRKVLLSHFPYAEDHTDDPRHTQFRLRDEGEWLIHGHVHEAYTVRQRGVNVGVDRWDFRPVSALTVARLIDDVENHHREED